MKIFRIEINFEKIGELTAYLKKMDLERKDLQIIKINGFRYVYMYNFWFFP